MREPNDNPAPSSTTGWWHWETPPRSGMQRVIAPWEYRHLRGFAQVRFGAAAVLTGLGVITLTVGGYSPKAVGWSAWFLAGAAATFSFGAWELAIARSASART